MDFLEGRKDIFGGLFVSSKDYRHLSDISSTLDRSLTKWESDSVNGLWFQVDIQDCRWIPMLVERGFVFHHAQAHYVMMTKWLPVDRPSTLPRYPFTSVGVAGLVVNKQGDVLLMKERRSSYMGWKYPGGAADPGEDIFETAVREVKEETGVATEGISVLCFRHLQGFRWKDNSDIYFICVMKPVNENRITPNPCPNETSACKWMSREEISKLPEEEFRSFHREILSQYDKWKDGGRKGCFPQKCNDKKYNRNYCMYYVD